MRASTRWVLLALIQATAPTSTISTSATLNIFRPTVIFMQAPQACLSPTDTFSTPTEASHRADKAASLFRLDEVRAPASQMLNARTSASGTSATLPAGLQMSAFGGF